MKIEQIIKGARKLGITMTNAEIDTELCQCWADRVELAMMRFEDGDMIKTQKWIDESNRYAI